jgi:phosphate transport system substrate-binding protein
MKYIITALLTLLLTNTVTAQTISGAGATFPYPVYAKWADAYKKQTGVVINYQSIGSGAGIKQIKANTVVFGASDMPLPKEELEKDGLVQFPTVLGALTLVYNIDGIEKPIVLDADVISRIYLGQIKNWNDPVIATLNPGVKFPNLPIVVVYRSDGSGTTFVFTQYLSAVSDTWKTSVGSNTSVKFPVGVGGKGNEGVAATVKQIKGAIGYVEFAYVKQNNLSFSHIINSSGVTVEPDMKSFQAGAGVINNKEKSAWPITSLTYILIHKNPKDVKLADQTLKFFEWAYKNGDDMAMELYYIPLSKEIKESIMKNEWSQIKRN